MKNPNIEFSFINTHIYPIEYGFNIEDIRKLYEEKNPTAKVEFTKNDPSPYNMLRAWEDAMIGIASNIEEASRVPISRFKELCQYMTTDSDLETLTIEFDNNFRFNSLVAPGIYKQFQEFVSNYDVLGNHLPGIYDGRYSFDPSNEADAHWIYSFGFLHFCLRTMKIMLEDNMGGHCKIVRFYLYSDYMMTMKKSYNGYVFRIRMPGHSFPLTPEFFSKMNNFRVEKMMERAKYEAEAKSSRD